MHDLLAVNRVVRAARAASGLPLLFTAVAPPHRLVLFADASSITSSSASAQTGYLVFLTSDAPVRGSLSPDTPLVLLAWGFHKQRRVTHSSFEDEMYSLLDGMRAAIEVACVLAHLTHGADSALAPIDAITDSLSLFNTMSAAGVVKPKEVNAGVAALREMYATGSMVSLSWVPAGAQLADSLTKPSSSASLRSTLATGCYGIRSTGFLTKTFETDRVEQDVASGLSPRM